MICKIHEIHEHAQLIIPHMGRDYGYQFPTFSQFGMSEKSKRSSTHDIITTVFRVERIIDLFVKSFKS